MSEPGLEPGAEPGVGVADLLPRPLGVAARCFARHCAADRLTIWLIVRSATTPPLGLLTTPCLLRATGTKRQALRLEEAATAAARSAVPSESTRNDSAVRIGCFVNCFVGVGFFRA